MGHALEMQLWSFLIWNLLFWVFEVLNQPHCISTFQTPLIILLSDQSEYVLLPSDQSESVITGEISECWWWWNGDTTRHPVISTVEQLTLTIHHPDRGALRVWRLIKKEKEILFFNMPVSNVLSKLYQLITNSGKSNLVTCFLTAWHKIRFDFSLFLF